MVPKSQYIHDLFYPLSLPYCINLSLNSNYPTSLLDLDNLIDGIDDVVTYDQQRLHDVRTGIRAAKRISKVRRTTTNSQFCSPRSQRGLYSANGELALECTEPIESGPGP